LVHNWNLLASISSAEISIECSSTALRIDYRIGFTELVVLSAIFAAVFLEVAHEVAKWDWTSIKIGILVWAALLGFNYVLSRIRFVWFLRATTEKILRENEFRE